MVCPNMGETSTLALGSERRVLSSGWSGNSQKVLFLEAVNLNVFKTEYSAFCVLNRFSHVQLCDPVDCRPPGSSCPRDSQARALEWVAVPFSRGSSQPRDRTCVSYISCIGRWILYH